MLILHTNPMSRGRIARWMLEEIGQPYEARIVDYGAAMKGPEFRAINPMGKVPVLVRDQTVITECAAICCWLAEEYPESGLMAEDRASFYRWMFFAAGPMDQAVTNASFGWKPANPKEAARIGSGSLDEVAKAVTDHLERHAFFADGRFTAADVYAGSQVAWGLRFGTLPGNAVLADYVARITARPAFIAANAKDDALLPPRT